MSDESILIPIEAQDDFTAVFDKAEQGILDINKALVRLIESEKARAASDDATKIFESMTDAEKDAFLAASKLEQQNEKTGMSFTELRSIYSTVIDVFRAGQKVYNETVGVTLDLANSVRQFRDVTGQTAEESSRLIQVLDDYKISTEDAEKATKKLASEGLQFNIDTLASLSDEFLALNAGQERTKFLYDNFGKSGEKFAELMLLGGDAIREKNAAISESLILGDKQLEQAREYERNLDDVNDKILAQKVAIGNVLLPALSNAFDMQKRMNELIMNEGLTAQQAQFQAAQELMHIQKINTESVQELKTAREDEIDTAYQSIDANEELKMSLEELSAKNQELFGLMGDFDSIADTYVEKTTDLKEQEAELLAQKQALVDSGYTAESQAIQDVNAKLDENIQAQQEAAAAAEEATKRRIAALIETKLSADGLTDEELTALLTLNKEWGLMSESAATAAQQVNDAVNNYLTTGNLDDFTSSVEGITDALLQLPEEKTVKIDVELTVNGQTASAQELFGLLAVEA